MDAPFCFVDGGVGVACPAIVRAQVLESFLVDDLRAHTLAAEIGQRAVGVDIAQRQGIAIVTGVSQEDAGTVIVGCRRVKVARRAILTTGDLGIVANAIFVHVCRAIAIAHAEGIHLAHTVVHIVANAVFILVCRTGAVADTDGIHLAYAIIHIITDTVPVGIRRTGAATHVDGVKLVSEAVAVSGRDARAVAHAAFIKRADTGVDVVADAILISISCAVATADANGINLPAIAIAITSRYVRAAAFINGAGAIANATGIHCANAGVNVIADAVAVRIRRAGTTAIANGVRLVSVAIAVPSGNVRAAAFKDGAGATAYIAGVQRGAGTVVDRGTRVVVAS